MPFVIGLVGPIGSGCSYIATEIFVKEKHYHYFSLSDYLRSEYILQHEGVTVSEITREQQQDFGNELREQSISFLADKVIAEIDALPKNTNVIVDSFRNPGEIEAFKKHFIDFYVIGVSADKLIRYDRVSKSYNNNLGKFELEEQRDKGEKIEYGQRVTDAFLYSDAIIKNELPTYNGNKALSDLTAKIDRYLALFLRTLKLKTPYESESIMALAYANSLRSQCMQRKVGAVIADTNGNIFSSGYNEVPLMELPCTTQYGICYRKYAKSQIEDIFESDQTDIKEKVMDKVKFLEKCRALHAEENAILNIAKFGSSSALIGSTLYTTTYPCNLCANKIAQVGIKKIVYFEPYPVQEAKKILDSAKVEQEMFEGITFNAYFEVFNEVLL